MAPYFAAILLSCLALVGERNRPAFDAQASQVAYRRRSATPWLIATGILLLFSGTRVGVGTDYGLYEYFWQRVNVDDLDASLNDAEQEYGYILFEFLLKSVSEDSQWLFFATAAVTVIPVIWIVRRESLNPALAIWLYGCLGSYLLPFNVMRQGIAATILFVAAVKLLERRPIWFVLFAAVASTVHASAIPAALVMLVCRKWKPRPVTAIAVVGAATLAAGFFVGTPAFADLVSTINPRYATYIVNAPAGVGTYLTLLAKFGLVVLCYVRREALTEPDRRHLLFSLIGVSILAVGTQSFVLAREDIYFSFFLILVVPNVLERSGSTLLKYLIVVGGAIYLVLLLQNYAGLLGYSSSLFN